MRHGCFRVFGFALLGMALPETVPAANVFCVADDAQLALALTNAENFTDTIKLVQGTYHLDGTVWHDPGPYFDPEDSRVHDGTQLLGGYTAGCASRDIAAGNTILRDDTATNSTGTQFLGDLTIEGITFRLKQGLTLHNDFYPDDGFPTNPSPQIVIRRSVFQQTTGDNALDVDTAGEGSIRVVDSLFAGNTTTGASCTVLFILRGGSVSTTFINNTVVGNGEGGVCLYDYASGAMASHLAFNVYNNILYNGNGGTDLYSDSDNTVLVDNILAKHSYPTLNTAPTGTINADPQLQNNYRPVEPTSPAINSGSESVPGGLPASDLDGGPRVVGSTVDRGAYESNIDDSTVQTVTNNDDSGAGSLRQAIIDANLLSGSNSIRFAIGSGCGPHVITLDSGLPALASTVSINGYTQTGASPNDLDTGDDAAICVILQAGNTNVNNGLRVDADAPAATKVTVRGLAFSGFDTAAINLKGGANHIVSGIRVGGNASGVALDPVGIGVYVDSGVSGVTIGGSDVSARNIIGDAIDAGIHLAGASSPTPAASDNQIVNNYVGLGWNQASSAFTNRGNGGSGIFMAGDHNAVYFNQIAANGIDGVQLNNTGAHDNLIVFNQIGTVIGNGRNGVTALAAAYANNILLNTIAQNTGAGVRIASGQQNEISQNSIQGNGGLGIDLAGAGVTPNDDDSAAQAADYANRGLNFPVLTDAIGGHAAGYVRGSLTTTPGDYQLELYANPSCDISGYGQGGAYIGIATVSVTADPSSGQGTATFEARIVATSGALGGSSISATAIDGVGNTSEFSACLSYVDDTIFDSGFE